MPKTYGNFHQQHGISAEDHEYKLDFMRDHQAGKLSLDDATPDDDKYMKWSSLQPGEQERVRAEYAQAKAELENYTSMAGMGLNLGEESTHMMDILQQRVADLESVIPEEYLMGTQPSTPLARDLAGSEYP